MFADDTAIILRNQAKADATIEILDTYSKALEAKVNTTKLYLIKIGEPLTVQLLGIKIVSDDNLYEYLGIPLGIRNMQQLQRYQEKIIEKFTKVRKEQARFYLSIKGRVLIANSLIMSLPRYALRFIPIPCEVRFKLERAYYRLVQDAKGKTLEKDFYAYMLRNQGGIGCIDIKSIVNAGIAATIARAVAQLSLPQAVLSRDIILFCLNSQILYNTVDSPQIQAFSLQIYYVLIYVGYQQTEWRRIYNAYKPRDSKVVQILEPRTRADTLNTNPQYYPLIGGGGGLGARRQNLDGQTLLQEAGAYVLGNLVDPKTIEPKIPIHIYRKVQRDNIRSRIALLLDSLLELQKEALRTTPAVGQENTRTYKTNIRFQETGKGSTKNKGLQAVQISFRAVYEILLRNRLKDIDFAYRIDGMKYAYQTIIGRLVPNALIQEACQTKLGIPKVGDLLQRIIYIKVKTGERLEQLEPNRKRYLQDNYDLSILYIQIYYEVVQAVQDKILRIQRRATADLEAEILRLRTKAKLIILIAVSPFPTYRKANNAD